MHQVNKIKLSNIEEKGDILNKTKINSNNNYNNYYYYHKSVRINR